MKKQYFVFLAALVFAGTTHAQQFFQFSQYLQNPYVINPASAGVSDNLDLSMSYRKQWSGIKDSPQTFYVSGNATLQRKSKSYKPTSVRISDPDAYEGRTNQKGKLRHALGGIVASDEYGLFKRTLGQVSYAVHVPLTKKWTISFGPSIGISNLRFDSDRATLNDPNDQTFQTFASGGTVSTNVFDLNFAGWLYRDEFFLGYSSYQLLKNEVAFGNVSTNANLEAYHNFIAGYNIKLNRNMRLIPSALVKHTTLSPTAFDINLKFDYQDRIWFGTSYRYRDAISLMTGFVINDLIKFGYSFDITTSELSNYSSGSHELILGVKLKK